jgi:hypothetical protein
MPCWFGYKLCIFYFAFFFLWLEIICVAFIHKSITIFIYVKYPRMNEAKWGEKREIDWERERRECKSVPNQNTIVQYRIDIKKLIRQLANGLNQILNKVGPRHTVCFCLITRCHCKKNEIHFSVFYMCADTDRYTHNVGYTCALACVYVCDILNV